MNFKHAMKKFYIRELKNHYDPGDMPETMASIIPEKSVHRASPLCLNIAFNGAAAALIVLTVFANSVYRNPMVDVLTTINEKYRVDAAIRQGLSSLPGCLQQYKKGGLK